ncbi:MAG: DUF5916 domain-containing protein [Gemmatimonadaceae bacterium]
MRTPIYQRPDDRLELDPTRTRLSGDAEQLNIGKVGGGITRFNLSLSRFSAGFEINDVGFLQRTDQQSQSAWFALIWQRPRSIYRRLHLNFNQWLSYTVARDALSGGPLRTEAGANVNGNMRLTNNWFVWSGLGTNNVGPTYCDVDCTRGGPAVRLSRSLNGWLGAEGDDRKRIIPSAYTSWRSADEGNTHSWSVQTAIEVRASSRLGVRVGPNYSHTINDAQFVRNSPIAGAPRQYTFGRLDQDFLAITTRVNVAATPTLSFQLYWQPFVAAGKYGSFKALGDLPRAESYEDRYDPFGTTLRVLTPAEKEALEGTYRVRADFAADRDGDGTPELAIANPDFNIKQLRSNVVARWEYRPGSTLFVVWSQGRDQFDLNPGTFRSGRDLRDLFGTHPDNTFLIKASYWFNF